MPEKDTFLTETQIEILKFRKKGLTQTEIARNLGTSRANICSIEKRARQNIEKAHKTLKLATRIEAPVSMRIKPGDDILESAKLFFKTADEADIQVRLDTPSLVSEIKRHVKEKLKGRIAIREIKLYLTLNGDVIIL